MKFFAASLALALAAPAMAAPTVAAVAAPTMAAETAPFNLDTPIEAIYANPAAAAVMEANLPGMDKHPAYDMFKAMSLRAVQPYSQGLITEAVLAKLETELAAIK